MAHLQSVIIAEMRTGLGKGWSDPVRMLRQFWSTDGTLLAEIDPSLPDDWREKLKRLDDLESRIATIKTLKVMVNSRDDKDDPQLRAIITGLDSCLAAFGIAMDIG